MFNYSTSTIEAVDPDLWQAIQQENQRQEDHIELIASENYTSPAVMEAQGSQLTNKYAEGYPGKRYYGGCEYVDMVEQLAIDRAKQLFGADYANVQPHSGSQANAGVYLALLNAGDTILGMSLAHGGHLTHGAKVNASGKLFNAVQYGVNDQGLIDYDEVERLALEHKPKMIVAGFSAFALKIDFARLGDHRQGGGRLPVRRHGPRRRAGRRRRLPEPGAARGRRHHHHPQDPARPARRPDPGEGNEEIEKKLNSAVFPGAQGGPLMHVIAAKAVAFKEALEPEFKTYQQQVVENARVLAETLVKRGLRIVSGRTESHLMLVDLQAKKITGKAAEAALGAAHITVNKNAIPNDPEKPFVTSGIRLGSPAMTTRGFGAKEAEIVGNLIADVLEAPEDAATLERVRGQVAELTRRFPVYSGRS